MTEPATSASEFFNEIGDRYDEVIARCVPRYHEMLDQMLDYLPGQSGPMRILELGCGSGNLTTKIIKRYPESKLTVVDASEKMISLVENRFQTQTNVVYVRELFQNLDFANDSFDLVLSSISIHHLTDPEKLDLFSRTREWLSEGCIFSFCDQFAGESANIYARHISCWKQASFEMGATEQEWADWMDHQQDHDFHSSLQTHLSLLEKAGYGSVDCLRRHYLWTTLSCH